MTTLAMQMVVPCRDWRGYDARLQSDICGPAANTASEQELLDFEKRHLPDLKRSVEADLIYTCGLRNARWRSYARIASETPLHADPVFRRFGTSQMIRLNEWQGLAKQSVIKMYGVGVSTCRSFIGSQTLLNIDRLAYSSGE